MLAAGAMLGAYRILRELGQGGMGTVYLGEHALLGRPAAIKVLLPGLSEEEDAVHRFFNEARAVTRIADPGIVQVFDFGYHTDGSAFIVMELLEGDPLDQRLERIGRFGLREGLRLVRMICASLEVAHAKGVVHRDLKPANIFLVADAAMPGGERAKILDFGIAKLSGGAPGAFKTLSGVLLGTPEYMSPEQCRGANRGDAVDHRADVYAMACMMFTMLTGRPPFQGEIGELISAHLREPPPLASQLVPGLPIAIDQVLQRGLQKAPGDRFPSMAAMIEAIDLAAQALYRPGSEPDALAEARAASWPGGGLTDSGASSKPKEAARTTLSGASGQLRAAGSGELARRRWVSALVAAAIVSVGGVGFLIARGGGAEGAVHGSSGGPITDPAVVPGAIADEVAPAAPATAAVADDAGVADAPSRAAAIDATTTLIHIPQPARPAPKPPSRGDEHATSRRPAPRPSENDRGD